MKEQNETSALPAVQVSTPIALLQAAVASGASPEALEKLMALQERFEANEARKQFYAAMHDFQSIKPSLNKASKVNFSTSKGTTAYNFCALPEIEKALREPLSKVGLSYRFENFAEGSEIGVRCIVSHVSGHSESTAMKAPVDNTGNKNGIQGIGSTTTYLMRYSLIAAFALTTADEDDDGGGNSDMPYLTLMKHNAAVRDNFEAINAIKIGLRDEDWITAAEIWCDMHNDVKSLLWTAPTKGGIFTTKERSTIQDTPFSEACSAYQRQKHSQQDQ